MTSKRRVGDKSGIGISSVVNGQIRMRRYVDFGPELRVITRNYCSSETDTPMQQQEYTEGKKVVIGDDVWTDARIILLY